MIALVTSAGRPSYGERRKHIGRHRAAAARPSFFAVRAEREARARADFKAGHAQMFFLPPEALAFNATEFALAGSGV